MPTTTNNDDIFPPESNPTVYYSQNNPINPQPIQSSQSSSGGNDSNNMTRQFTTQTMAASVANPYNKENPFENESPLNLNTVSEEELNKSKKNEPQDIFDPNAKLQNPFDIPTLPVDEENKMKISSQQFPKDNTLFINDGPITQENIPSLKISGGINTSNQNINDKSPLDIPTIPVEELNKIKTSGKDPFNPTSTIKDPFDQITLPLEEIQTMNISGQNSSDPNTQIKDSKASS